MENGVKRRLKAKKCFSINHQLATAAVIVTKPNMAAKANQPPNVECNVIARLAGGSLCIIVMMMA